MGEAAEEMWGMGDYRKIAADHQIMCERLCETLCVTPRHYVLDVACGTGNATIAIARRRAKVVGVDFSQPLLDRARQRVEVEGFTDVNFVHGDIRAMDFPDSSFDIVISTVGATFMVDQAAMARELLRVVKPGGRIALTTYARQSLPSDIYHIAGDLSPRPSGVEPVYTWTDGNRAADLLGHACSSIEISHHSYDACFNSAEEFFDHNIAYYGPMLTRYGQMPLDQQEIYKSRVIAAMQKYNRATDGSLVARFNYASIIAVRDKN